MATSNGRDVIERTLRAVLGWTLLVLAIPGYGWTRYVANNATTALQVSSQRGLLGDARGPWRPAGGRAVYRRQGGCEPFSEGAGRC